MSQGLLLLVLHAHLPFVRHPEHEDFLEEDWLYEAISECYLPLLLAFDRLAEQGVRWRVTMTLSPTLVSMLRDELLLSRYARRLEQWCELGAREVHRTRKDATFGPLARFHRELYESLRHAFHERYKRDLVGAFRRLQEAGHLELITCNATHGFLPLMQHEPEAVRAQVSVAAWHYRSTFGRNPPGIWLAECGYYPGLERLLAAERIRYFFVDTHALTQATPRPLYGPYAPVYTQAGVAAYARDPHSSEQVWSAEHGYPGDPLYREFYRDIGWDLDMEHLRPFVQPTGERKGTGFKYYRITGRTQQAKLPYLPGPARQRARAHAEHFLARREQQLQELARRMGSRTPVVVAPYDAELYGHWWFEGPLFLEHLLRLAADSRRVRLATPSEDLWEHPENQVCTLPLSSWGQGGYARMWLDETNDWLYRHLYACTRKMIALARDFPEPTALQRRALDQAARELLLAQSSDWAFILKTGTMVQYATRRVREHVLRFLRLHDMLRAGRVDEPWLARTESRDNLFPALDYRVYRPG